MKEIKERKGRKEEREEGGFVLEGFLRVLSIMVGECSSRSLEAACNVASTVEK